MNIETITEKRNHARRVVFVKPQGAIQEQVIPSLLAHEYEASYVTTTTAAEKAIEKFADPILYINIDEKDGVENHKQWVDSILSKYSDKNLSLGVINDHPNRDLAEHYLFDLNVSNGYTFLKSGLADVTKSIIANLETQKAKGDRRHVRVRLFDGSDLVSFSIAGRTVNCTLYDMSVVSFAFISEEEIPHGTIPQSMTLTLHGKQIVVEGGEVVGYRHLQTGLNVHIYHFEHNLSRSVVEEIYNFMQTTLQREVMN